MNYIWLIFVAQTIVIYSSVYGMQNDTDIILISNDDKKVALSQKAAQLSYTINKLCTIPIMTEAQYTEVECKKIQCNAINGEVLTNIAHLLENNATAKKKGVQLSIDVVFGDKKDNLDYIQRCLVAVDFLEIPFLTNQIAQLLVYESKNNDIKSDIKKKRFSENITMYLKKHYTLKQCGVNEKSVEQYLSHTYPKKTKEEIFKQIFSFGPCCLYLGNGKMTNLNGIEFLADESITHLSFTKNFLISCYPSRPVKVFSMFTGLKNLNLSYCKIKTIPKDLFVGLHNLTILHLSNNNIKELHSNIFHYLHNLKELYLEENKIQVLYKDTFKKLSQLTWLTLYKNRIRKIHDGAFNGLDKLGGLLICNNKIQKITGKTFEGADNLSTLNLSKNEIKEIGENTFKKMSLLIFLYLD